MHAWVLHEMVRMPEVQALMKVTHKTFDADKMAAVYGSPYLFRGAGSF